MTAEEADTTFVTAAIDIGRKELSGETARPFSFYAEHLKALASLGIPLVVYGVADLGFREQAHQVLVPFQQGTLESLPGFDTIQEIRTSENWRDQAAWLRSSPQACLPHYNPLVMSKLGWLADEARLNRFGTKHFAWIDAGISHTVPLQLLSKTLHGAALENMLRKFLLICFPYRASTEVHGFELAAMERLAGGRTVEWVARGGFFGGLADYVVEANNVYQSMLSYTLHQRLMGTEESILTILGYLHPEIFETYFVGNDGKIWPFFADLADRRADR
ncbi:WlaTC/HtrL family glycosyltransferase [Hoeflea sp.]|uniref:WlaTC/HtrL family glycosyltransferase n=1 Tax=Hoeflea sp. TaxID=1940281 RepID=UPI003B01F8FA